MPSFTSKKNYDVEYKMFSKKESPIIKRRRFNQKNNTISKSTGATAVSAYDELISELDYSYDSLATISVIFDSLRFTYATSKKDIEQLINTTMLGDMEKELLIAYDDLSLQIKHLEKNITKIEEKILKLKDEECLLYSPSSLSSENTICD